MEWATVQQGPPWAVDSWGLGCMMQVGITTL
jgi:SCY1-like protein 1